MPNPATLKVAALVIAIGPLHAWPTGQSSNEVRNERRPAFEVASIKSLQSRPRLLGGGCGGTDDRPGTGALAAMAGVSFAPTPPGVCSWTAVTLKMLIVDAYGLSPPGLVDKLLVGGPDWIDSNLYEIRAKAEMPAPRAQLRLMLQTLLADRFGFAFHRETRHERGFALVVASDGPKMQKATGQEKQPGIFRSGGPWRGESVSMREFSTFLSTRLRRPVVDETKLPGGYTFTLRWTPGDDEQIGLGTFTLTPEMRDKLRQIDPPDGPTLYTALQEQLGLRLEQRREVPVEMMIIDRAHLPTEN